MCLDMSFSVLFPVHSLAEEGPRKGPYEKITKNPDVLGHIKLYLKLLTGFLYSA